MIAGCVVASFFLGRFMAGVVSASATDCVPATAIPRSCTLLKDTRAVFVGSRTEETPRYRFHVEEKIKGVTSDYFDLEPYPISGHFERARSTSGSLTSCRWKTASTYSRRKRVDQPAN